MIEIPAGVAAGCGCAAELLALRAEVAELRAAVDRLMATAPNRPSTPPADAFAPAVPGVDRERVARDRLALFRSLFIGRDDVYAQRWEKEDGRSGWAPQIDRGPGQSWQEARDARQYRPLTDAVLRSHLSGKITAGLYPMLMDDTCRLLVCDFDGDQWQLDAQAYVRAARVTDVPVAVEVSRSGEGGHVWVFFSEPCRCRCRCRRWTRGRWDLACCARRWRSAASWDWTATTGRPRERSDRLTGVEIPA